MSVVTSESNKHFDKFIANTKRVIKLTIAVLKKIEKTNPEIYREYATIPQLLEFAEKSLDMPEIGNAAINGFLNKALNNLEELKSRNDSILINKIDVILPDNPFNSKIQFLYGNNSQGKCYVCQKDIDALWNLAHGLLHNSVKHCVTNNIEPFRTNILERGIIEDWNIDFTK